MTRRAATVLALALCLLGCGPLAPPNPTGEPVHLLTGAVLPNDGCFTNNTVAELTVDPKYGTAITSEGRGTVPVMWRPGFTGWWDGSVVRVRDPEGDLVATTGRTYQLWGAYWDNNGIGNRVDLDGNPLVYWACGDVTP